jgi:pyroglutamyl-peptidase
VRPWRDKGSHEPQSTALMTPRSQPFMEWTVNASYVIASTLPSTISPSSNNPLSPLRQINLIVHKPAIRTSYHDVRTEVPKFFAEHKDKDIDLVLQMGNGYPDHYSIETQSFRDDYNVWADVDDQYARDLCDLPGGEHLWRDTYKAPKILKTAVQPVGELWRRTESLLLGKGNTADVRLSDDPGHYLCGFIYYEGLVERWRHGDQRNVLFLHVRPWLDDETIEVGREVAMAVIRAAVEMIEKRRDKEEKEKGSALGGCCVVS